MCDSYFEREDITLSYPEESSNTGMPSTGLSNVVVHSSSSENETTPIVGVVKVVVTSCLAVKEGSEVVLQSLIQVRETAHI